MIKHITTAEFQEEVLNYNGKVLVDFFATWCGPCQMLGKILEKLDEENLIKIVKIDIDKDSSLAIDSGVEVVPTIFIYENGNIIKREEGFMDINSLKKII